MEINERREERMKKLFIFFIRTLFTSNVLVEVYSEPCQTSKLKTFVKIFNGFTLIDGFAVNYFC